MKIMIQCTLQQFPHQGNLLRGIDNHSCAGAYLAHTIFGHFSAVRKKLQVLNKNLIKAQIVLRSNVFRHHIYLPKVITSPSWSGVPSRLVPCI